jgi:hypothetical protein
MLASSCPNRRPSDVSDDWSSEDHQMAHVEPLLRRTEPRRPDAATFPGPRRLDVVYRRSGGPDLDARSDHASIIGIRRPSGIVPRFQPNTTPVRNPTRTGDHPPPTAGRRRRRPPASTHHLLPKQQCALATLCSPATNTEPITRVRRAPWLLTSGSMPCSRARWLDSERQRFGTEGGRRGTCSRADRAGGTPARRRAPAVDRAAVEGR